MIDFEQVMNSLYSDIIQDIYCCDCLVDKIMDSLLFKELSSDYNEFALELKREFPKNFLFLSFGGVCVFICKDSFKFIKGAEKIIPVVRKRCIFARFNLDGQNVIVCTPCLIKTIGIGELLHHFRLVDKYRRNVRYIHL